MARMKFSKPSLDLSSFPFDRPDAAAGRDATGTWRVATASEPRGYAARPDPDMRAKELRECQKARRSQERVLAESRTVDPRSSPAGAGAASFRLAWIGGGTLVASAMLSACATGSASMPSWRVEPHSRVEPGCPQAAAAGYLAVANRFAGEGRMQQAADAYRSAAGCSPSEAAVLAESGLALARLGQLPAAIELLYDAQRLAPTSAPTANNLGYALLLSGRENEAVRAFNHALAVDPAHAAAQANLQHVERQASMRETRPDLTAAVAVSLQEPATQRAVAPERVAASGPTVLLSLPERVVPRAEASPSVAQQPALGSTAPGIRLQSPAEAPPLLSLRTEPNTPAMAMSVMATVPRVEFQLIAKALPPTPARGVAPLDAPVEGAIAAAEAEAAMQSAERARAQAHQPVEQIVSAGRFDQGTPAQPAPMVVVNGNGRSGAAADWRRWLGARGVTVGRLANRPPYDTAVTVVEYRPGFDAQARALARAMPFQVTVVALPSALVAAEASPLRLVVGSDALLPPDSPTALRCCRPAILAGAGVGVLVARP